VLRILSHDCSLSLGARGCIRVDFPLRGQLAVQITTLIESRPSLDDSELGAESGALTSC
jgi:hypothetical protein